MKLQFIYPGGTWAAGLQHIPSDPFAPPLGILYLSSLLELAGHTVHVIDYWGEQFNQDRLKSQLNNCDAVGVSITGFNLQESLYICHEIKEIDAEIPLLIGGPYVTLYPKKSVIESHADIGIEGEGEPGIVKIVDALQGKAEIDQVNGIIYHDKDRIKRGKAPSIVRNLDTLPFPSRSLVKKYQYGFILGAKVTKGKTTSFLSSRGCPMNCRFCQRNFFGMKNLRLRSTKNIIEELKMISDEGYNTVLFVDDNFLTDRRHIEPILDGIIEEKLDLELWAEARVSSANDALYKKMKQAGFKTLAFGIESGNQDVLDFYGKNITLNQITRAIKLCRKIGFFTYGTFILGAPIETADHFKRTKQFAKSLPLDIVAFFVLEYGAGSPLWEEAVKEGKISHDEYLVFADLERGLSNFRKEEIDLFAQRAHHEFYFNGKYLIDQVFQAFRKRDFRLIRTLLKVARQKTISTSYWGK